MADPLSVAGLAAGVVSLGLQVTGSLVSYFDAIKNRDDDLALAKRYANTIQLSINHLRSSAAYTSASQVARDNIRASVDACKVQLQALSELVDRLSTSQGGASTIRHKIRDSSNKLVYAFHRPDIKELEDRLSRANVALQGAMQVLGLDVQHYMNETLKSVRADTGLAKAGVESLASDMLVVRSETTAANTRLRDVTAVLPAIAEDAAKTGPLIVDQVGSMNFRLAEQSRTIRDGFMKGTQMNAELSVEVMQRFDQMENFLRSLKKDILDAHGQSTDAIAARLMSAPSTLREVVDVTETLPSAAQNQAAPQTSSFGVTNHRGQLPGITGKCNCRLPRKSRQRKQRKWGPLLAFDEIEIIELHRPDCELSPFATKSHNRKLGLSYIGLRAVASWAISYTFSASLGAGGHSISPHFTYYPTVNKRTSPAFRTIRLLSYALDSHWSTEEKQYFVNMFLALLSICLPVGIKMDTGIGDAITDMITMLLGYYGARPVSCNVHGEMPFSGLIDGLTHLNHPCESAGDFVTRVFNIILPKTPETPLSSDQNLTSAWYGYAGSLIYVLGMLGSSEDSAEAFGCGPLSLAILAQDVSRVETILDTSPSSMDETTTLGLTPLHLALDKPTCMRLLLSRTLPPAQLNMLEFCKNVKARREALKHVATSTLKRLQTCSMTME
ncbi:hypothetical protein PG996_007850 [Apiospora saccharicola]|uniref:Fungal N-terminal domain-containing protein n=1 Tax=Apiospora saccharicola TaxID=335842 RepID=A0ABR1UZH2_9PEZI